ncbi:hypothetical protein D3C75_996600 [compost metagenome]
MIVDYIPAFYLELLRRVSRLQIYPHIAPIKQVGRKINKSPLLGINCLHSSCFGPRHHLHEQIPLLILLRLANQLT